jgi:hypothetical protein
MYIHFKKTCWMIVRELTPKHRAPKNSRQRSADTFKLQLANARAKITKISQAAAVACGRRTHIEFAKRIARVVRFDSKDPPSAVHKKRPVY